MQKKKEALPVLCATLDPEEVTRKKKPYCVVYLLFAVVCSAALLGGGGGGLMGFRWIYVALQERIRFPLRCL